jgi:hypothetical protein
VPAAVSLKRGFATGLTALKEELMLVYLGTTRTGKVYKIDRGECCVLGVGPSVAVYEHSREFTWSYRGSGPAQLALALLLDATGMAEMSRDLHQRFKDEFVANWGDEFVITAERIVEWARKVLAEGI